MSEALSEESMSAPPPSGRPAPTPPGDEAIVPALDGRAGRIAIIAARLVLAAVFLFAAVPKVIDPTSFARDIDNYHMLPDAFLGPLAIVMPLAEIVVALAWLSGVHARGASVVGGGMLVVFIVAMAQALARGIDLDCGCFGSALESQVSGLTIARNVALLALAALVALGPSIDWRRPFGSPPREPPA